MILTCTLLLITFSITTLYRGSTFAAKYKNMNLGCMKLEYMISEMKDWGGGDLWEWGTIPLTPSNPLPLTHIYLQGLCDITA